MKRSHDRILATHAGALPRSDALRSLVFARAEGTPYDAGALAQMLRDDVTGRASVDLLGKIRSHA